MTGPWRRGPRRDGGSASVLVLALSAVTALVAAVLVAVGAAAVVRARAASAADQGALAAASHAQDGQVAACSRASRVVDAAGARLVRCALTGAVAEVEVAVSAGGPLSALGPAAGRARAGPAP